MYFTIILGVFLFPAHHHIQLINALSHEELSLTTSVVGMQNLITLEKSLIDLMHTYANDLEKKLNILRKVAEDLSVENNKAQNDTEKYLSNPLNSFSLTRRLHLDWIKWQQFLLAPAGKESIERIQSLLVNSQIPTKTDLTEAATAMHRLQNTYDLKPHEMTKGILNNKTYDAKLAVMDSYTLGCKLFENNLYYEAGGWFFEALNDFQPNAVHESLNFEKITIYEFYAETMLKQLRYNESLLIITLALQEYPTELRLLRKKFDIETLMKIDVPPSFIPPNNTIPLFIKGCRGQYPVTNDRHLHCRYNKTTTPFLKLAPLKMEELHLDPYMVLYHDALYDNEIKQLQSMAQPLLQRATILKKGSLNESTTSDIRTAKFAWIRDTTNKLTKSLIQRYEDMTGFDTVDSELIQVANYGLGGHYALHNDFFNISIENTDHPLIKREGNRIATLLIYMSDVEQGGATVFPNIQKAVFPRKGTAIMWYNLNNALEGDRNTLHTGCPVLVGSKWVTNQWIRSKNQMFRRPCFK